MNQRDFDILRMLRPRLIKTGIPRLIKTEKVLGCRDRDSSRLGSLMDVETETSRDWAKDVDTETPSRLSLISDMSNTSYIVSLHPNVDYWGSTKILAEKFTFNYFFANNCPNNKKTIIFHDNNR